MSFPTDYIVPWSGRGLKYSDEEIRTVVDVMQNSDPMTQGRHQKEFEAKFANLHASPHAFAMATGTAALEIAAILCDLKPGDEVILPAHTFAATAIPFARTGAKLVWADIEPKTFVMSADTIRPLITPKTKVIVVVHLYGLMVDMREVMKLANEHEIRVVEDAAQSLGATLDCRMAGSWGDFGCFSFHGHKNISTLGEGGALLVRDSKLAAHIPGLRHNGVRSFAEPREKYWIPAMSNVDFDLEGVWPYNFCIGEVQCALATKLLERIESINQDRRARARRIKGALQDYPELEFQKVEDEKSTSFHLLAARFNMPGFHRDELIERLAKEHRVKSVVQYYPLYRYPLFIRGGFGTANCPETDAFFDNMISLPFQHWLTLDQEKHLIGSLQSLITDFRKQGVEKSARNQTWESSHQSNEQSLSHC